MKTSLTILFFLFQALFISVSGMSETPVPTDSSSIGKSFVVLLNGNEIFGEIISQTDDSVNIKTENNLIVRLPTKLLSCIIHLEDNYNPNNENESNKNYMFYMEDKTIKYGSIISIDGTDIKVMFDNGSVSIIGEFDYIFIIPSYQIKNIQYFNNFSGQFSRLFFKDEGFVDGQIIIRNSRNIKLIIKSKYFIVLPWDYIYGELKMSRISDTSEMSLPTHRVILKIGHELTGNIISKSKDSLLMKVSSGFVTNIYNKNIDNIYDYQFYSWNVIYFEAATFLFLNSINLSYERLFIKNFSIRLGYGYGSVLYMNFSERGEGNKYFNGILLLANYIEGDNESKFEIGGGINYLLYNSSNFGRLLPAIVFNYRYQPKYGGIVYRIGVSLMVLGSGLNFSIGYTF